MKAHRPGQRPKLGSKGHYPRNSLQKEARPVQRHLLFQGQPPEPGAWVLRALSAWGADAPLDQAFACK